MTKVRQEKIISEVRTFDNMVMYHRAVGLTSMIGSLDVSMFPLRVFRNQDNEIPPRLPLFRPLPVSFLPRFGKTRTVIRRRFI